MVGKIDGFFVGLVDGELNGIFDVVSVGITLG